MRRKPANIRQMKTSLMSQAETTLIDRAIRFVIQKDDNSGDFPITGIGKLRLPLGSAEAERCVDIKGILEEYADRTNVSRPLSIAVFGPPGSGKSHCVEEIVGSIFGDP